MKVAIFKDSQFRHRFTVIASVSLVLMLIFSLKRFPDFIENYYSRGLYIFIRKGFQFLFNYIPFSTGDVLYIAVIVVLIIGAFRLARFLFQKQFSKAGQLVFSFIVKLGIAVAIFYIFWALNYFRQPAKIRLKLPEYQYNVKQLITITSMLIDSANQSRALLTNSDLNATTKQIVDPAVKAIEKLTSFNPPLISIKPFAKPSLMSPLLNYIGTAGYYNPFTGEAQFNNLMPVFTQPFVACHEMAHQMGFGAEDEANFAGFIAGKSSDNLLLRYSAYYLASQEFMNEVWRTDSVAFRQMKERISPAVIRDLEVEKAYWTKYQGSAARLSSIFYDNYLKANKQPGGLKTYNRMIKLSMAYFKQKGLVE